MRNRAFAASKTLRFSPEKMVWRSNKHEYSERLEIVGIHAEFELQLLVGSDRNKDESNVAKTYQVFASQK